MAAVTIGDLVRSTRGVIILSDLLAAVSAVLSIAPFVALTQIAAIWLGEGRHEDWVANPWSWAATAVVTLLVYQLLYLMSLGVTHFAEVKLWHQLRGLLMEAFSRLPPDKVAQIPHGVIRKTVCDDTAAIHALVARVPDDVTNVLIDVVAGAVYLFWTDWWLALALIGLWVLTIAVVTVTIMRGLGGITLRFGEAQTGLTAATVRMLEGIREIENFQATDATRARFSAVCHRFSGLSYRWISQSRKSINLSGVLLRLATVSAIVAALAVVFMSQGWIELSAALPFFLPVPEPPNDLDALIGLVQHMYESGTAAQSTADPLSEEPIPQGALDQDDGDAPDRIEVDGITSSYKLDTPVLKGISLTTEPRAVTTLVGSSGGGKSTLTRLIAHFRGVDQGVVRISGVDVREAIFVWLLSRVAIVLQDVVPTNDSVFDNTVLGRPGVTRERVEAAVCAACVHDRTMCLSKGCDAILGEEDGFLSGGERQRVIFARAHLQDAPILVLDEATAQASP